MIHKSSVIDKGAKIGKDVKIGPFCYIGSKVHIGDNAELVSNIHIEGNTKIGNGTKIFPFASIGTQPQDLKYKGEKNSLIVGNQKTSVGKDFSLKNRPLVNIGNPLVRFCRYCDGRCLVLIILNILSTSISLSF